MDDAVSAPYRGEHEDLVLSPQRVRRRALRATRSPTIRDLEWAAGLIEGEGSFNRNPQQKRHADGTPVVYYSEQVCVVQKDPEPLYRLMAIFGGLIFRDKGYLRWQVNGARARGIMMTLYGLMTARRKKQIRYALWGEAEVPSWNLQSA